MAYSEKQKQMRRCQWVKTDGSRCRGFSKLDSKYCSLHSYNHSRTLPKKNERDAARIRRDKKRAGKQRRFTCTCSAFPFPHRLASGGCRYPDSPAEVYESGDADRAYEYEWERDIEPDYNGEAEAQSVGENKWLRENNQASEEQLSSRENLMSRIWSGEFDNDD
jgi:hypothetical protein